MFQASNNRRRTLLAFAALAFCFGTAVSAFADEAPVFDFVNRYLQAVVLDGPVTADLQQAPLASIRAMALTEKGFQSIPFQIDERLPDGGFVTERGKFTKDDTPGVLDGEDEIVVMARDVGFRAPKTAWPQGVLKSSEIQVTDPTTGATGFVYLFAFGSTAVPRLSERRYISYDATKDMVSSDTYQIGFDHKYPLIINYGVFKRMNDAGRDQNVIDRLKVRIKAITSAGVTITRNEEEFDQALTGVKVGPVRVVRTLELSVSIPPMPKVSITANFQIYADYADIPVDFTIPGLVNLFLKDMTVDVGVDFDKMKGITFATLERPKGTYVDGQQPQNERDIPMGSEEWFMMQGRGLNTFVVFELDKELKKRKLKKEIHFMDSDTGSNPPESIPGQLPEIGFELSQWGGLEARLYHFEAKLHFLWEAPAQGGSGYYKSLSTPFKLTASGGDAPSVVALYEQGDAAGEKLANAVKEKLGAVAQASPVKSLTKPATGMKPPPDMVVIAGGSPLPAIRSQISQSGSAAIVVGDESRVLDDGVVSVGLNAGPRVMLSLLRQFFTGQVKAAVVTNGLSKQVLKDIQENAQRFSIELVAVKASPSGELEASQLADVNAVVVWSNDTWTEGGGKAFSALLASAKGPKGPVPVFTNSRELVALGAAVGAEPNLDLGVDLLALTVNRYLKGESIAQGESAASQLVKIYLNKESVKSSKLLVPPALIRMVQTM